MKGHNSKQNTKNKNKYKKQYTMIEQDPLFLVRKHPPAFFTFTSQQRRVESF